MAVNEILVLLMFVATFGCLLAGFPVAFTLSGVALLFALFTYAFGSFDITFVRAMPQLVWHRQRWQNGPANQY